MLARILEAFARVVEACTGFVLGTTGACALVAATLICFALLLLGPDTVVQYMVDHFAAVKLLEA
jgi:hypothetical protein